MDAFIQFLIDWGYLGIFLSAFLAGTVVPFSSEAVLAALVMPSTGLSVVVCVACASVGNWLGSLVCYWMGRLGRIEWLEKYFRIERGQIERMRNYLGGKGSWVGFFSFLPMVGDVIAVALGFLRSSLLYAAFFMLAGKVVRYVFVVMTVRGLLTAFGL